MFLGKIVFLLQQKEKYLVDIIFGDDFFSLYLSGFLDGEPNRRVYLPLTSDILARCHKFEQRLKDRCYAARIVTANTPDVDKEFISTMDSDIYLQKKNIENIPYFREQGLQGSFESLDENEKFKWIMIINYKDVDGIDRHTGFIFPSNGSNDDGPDVENAGADAVSDTEDNENVESENDSNANREKKPPTQKKKSPQRKRDAGQPIVERVAATLAHDGVLNIHCMDD